jgi:cytosine/uracil/thiamine/allantoin permease
MLDKWGWSKGPDDLLKLEMPGHECVAFAMQHVIGFCSPDYGPLELVQCTDLLAPLIVSHQFSLWWWLLTGRWIALITPVVNLYLGHRASQSVSPHHSVPGRQDKHRRLSVSVTY